MTHEQYWNDDCTLPKYYRKAYELKRREQNHDLWLQGLYFYEALCDVAPVLRAFAKKAAPTPYPPEPYPLDQKDAQERKEREERSRSNKMKAKMNAFAVSFNAKLSMGRKEEADGQHD